MTDVVAILAPGDMGHGVGWALGQHGHDVITCLTGRSERTKGLARSANMRDVGSLETLVTEADVFLSILPPSNAVEQATAIADALKATDQSLVYVDCNAISPGTMDKVAAALSGTNAAIVDGGIIGLAPNKTPNMRLYVSGPDTSSVEAFDGKGFAVKALGPEIGRASGLKMVYAALTKGTWTLHTAILMTAARLSLLDDLLAEYNHSQQGALSAMRGRVPFLPADAGRWVGEMEEIADTFKGAGTPDGFHRAAADVFRILDKTPFAAETRETLDQSRTLEDALAEYVKYIDD